MKIKEVINKYHVSRKALLIYEEKGFIQPKRNNSDYREYSEQDIEMIKKILLLRKLEFSLEDIENIIINKQTHILKDKKDIYDKEIHFIETKKSYLDYVTHVMDGDYELEEALSAVDDTIKLYETNNYDDMIHFEYHRDTMIFLWFGSFMIALLSMNFYLIGISILLGILSFILSIKKVRYLFLSLPIKKIIGIIVMVICAIGFLVTFQKESSMQNELVCGMSVVFFFLSFSLFKEVIAFLKKYQNWSSAIFFVLGIILVGTMLWLQIDDSPWSFAVVVLGVESIILGAFCNSLIRKIILYVFMDLI